MRIAILTASAEQSTPLVDPVNGGFPNADYYAFVDRFTPVKTWQQLPLHRFSTDPVYGPRRDAKLPKMLGWLLVPGYDYYIWQDSVMEVRADPQRLVSIYLRGNVDMALWRHPERDCVYDEIQAVIDQSKDDPAQAQAAGHWLRSQDYPEHNGLFEMSSFVYPNSRKVQQAMLAWWELVCKLSSRDQITWPYVLHSHRLRYNCLPGTAMAYAGNNQIIPQVR